MAGPDGEVAAREGESRPSDGTDTPDRARARRRRRTLRRLILLGLLLGTAGFLHWGLRDRPLPDPLEFLHPDGRTISIEAGLGVAPEFDALVMATIEFLPVQLEFTGVRSPLPSAMLVRAAGSGPWRCALQRVEGRWDGDDDSWVLFVGGEAFGHARRWAMGRFVAPRLAAATDLDVSPAGGGLLISNNAGLAHGAALESEYATRRPVERGVFRLTDRTLDGWLELTFVPGEKDGRGSVLDVIEERWSGAPPEWDWHSTLRDHGVELRAIEETTEPLRRWEVDGLRTALTELRDSIRRW